MRVAIIYRTSSSLVSRLKSEAPIHWDALKTTSKEKIVAQISSLNNWYTRFLRLDEVKLYQDRVVTLQGRLLEAQEKRREVGWHLADIRKKSNQLQDEIHKVKRSDDLERFFTLMKEETDLLRLERDISSTFQECDRAERELFTAFTNAVRDSHEKQRAQLEYTKYFGIILSITGSFLAFCYSTLKKDDLKRFIEDSLAANRPKISYYEINNLKQKINDDLRHTKYEILKLIEQNNFVRDEKTSWCANANDETKQILCCLGASVAVLILLKILSS